MRKRFIHAMFFAVLFVLVFCAFEAALHIAVLFGRLPIKSPLYIARPFWGDIDRRWGVWHYENNSYRHKRGCFNVTYTSNSYGARDVDRTRQSGKDRVIVLGDSMIEGFGVKDSDRLTNILEKETGIAHLNFGTAGDFGPVQYLLLYRHLASTFTHSAIIIGLLPDNDFLDLDYDYWMEFDPGRYRPYLMGEYPAYSIKYPQKGAGILSKAKEALSDYTYSYRALSYLGYKIFGMPAKREKAKAGIYSGYYDFTEPQLQRVIYSIEEIKKLAAGKQVFLVVIPRLCDLQRYKSQGTPPLTGRLEAFSAKTGIVYVDLLDYMSRAPEMWEQYYLACDGHLSGLGNQQIAKYMLDRPGYYNDAGIAH